MNRKPTNFILALVLAALLPMAAMAQDYYDASVQPEGDGTTEAPFQVATLENMLWIAMQVNSGHDFAGFNFEQTQDIDFMPTRQWDEGRGWASIGGFFSINGIIKKIAFRGNYDGKNHKISNLYVNRNSDYQGLFGYIYSGTVSNLKIDNAHVTGTETLGILAGYAFEENITNCHVSRSTITGNSIFVGGLVGYMSASKIHDSSVDATVTGLDYLGGITSWCLEGEIARCATKGKINNIENTTEQKLGRLSGGLVGYLNLSTVSDCMSTAQVVGGDQMGGLVGVTVKSTVERSHAASRQVKGVTYVGGFIGKNEETAVNDCYARSTVEGEASVGGFIGSLDYTGSIVSRCYSTGKVTSTDDATAGGFVGNKSYTSAIKNCFYDKETSAQGEAVGGFTHNDCDCTGATTAQMKSQATFAGWDFNRVWKTDGGKNDGYPFLLSSPENAGIAKPGTTTGEVKVSLSGETCTIESAHSPLTKVEVFAINGSLLFSAHCSSANIYSFNLPATNQAAVIIRATLANDSTTATLIAN